MSLKKVNLDRKLPANPFLEAFMHLVPISSFEQLLELLSGLRPEEHHVLVNIDHPLIGGVPDRLPELVRGAGGGVFDFDGTWHPGNQWVGARGLMSPPDQAEDLRDIEAYFARPAHDDHDDVAFILRSIERLRRSDCSRSMLEALACGLVPRTGAAPLMKSIGFDRSAVITFGMYDVVRENLRRFLVHACWSQVEVFGLRLEWLPGQTFRGPLLPTVVTDGAKGYLRRAFCGSRGIAPNKTLVVGDSPTDIQMMGPDVVGCFLIPKVDPAPGRMAHRLARLEQMWGQVACVVVSDDLTPLLEMRQK